MASLKVECGENIQTELEVEKRANVELRSIVNTQCE
jgi:hypothetical protein